MSGAAGTAMNSYSRLGGWTIATPGADAIGG
jgi:hypothetical protein